MQNVKAFCLDVWVVNTYSMKHLYVEYEPQASILCEL